MSEAKIRTSGWKCPVRGCWGMHHKIFSSPTSVARHIGDVHGIDELVKRLGTKEVIR